MRVVRVLYVTPAGGWAINPTGGSDVTSTGRLAVAPDGRWAVNPILGWAVTSAEGWRQAWGDVRHPFLSGEVPSIKFTVEKGFDSSLAFLDIKFLRINSNFLHQIFRK